MKSVISVKEMIRTYVGYGIDESTWEMFYKMTCHDLISHDTWRKFSETCKGWYIDGDKILDSCNNDKIIYQTDDDGFFRKVA